MPIMIEAVVSSGEPSEGWAVLTADWTVIAVFFEREDASEYITNCDSKKHLWLRPARLTDFP